MGRKINIPDEYFDDEEFVYEESSELDEDVYDDEDGVEELNFDNDGWN